MTKNKNWEINEEEKLKDLYITQGILDPFELVERFPEKNHRSIISKLVQMKIYQKPPKPELKTHNTVKALLGRLEKILGIELLGFNLTKKENLIILVEAVEAKCKE